MFSDLECDMINPLEMCSKLNPVLRVKVIITYSLVCDARVRSTRLVDHINVTDGQLDSLPLQLAPRMLPYLACPAPGTLVRPDRDLPEADEEESGGLCKDGLLPS